MPDKNLPKGTLWITTHRLIFKINNTVTADGLFEIPWEIFEKESYFGGMFQSGHRVKIKREGSKNPDIYDSNVLDGKIKDLSTIKAEELKIDSSEIAQQYQLKISQRNFPNKITFLCPSKSVRNELKKNIDYAVSKEMWTKVKFDINQHIRQSDIGIGNIMGRQKEKNSVISNKIAMTSSDINQLSSTAQDLIAIADDIKKRLAKYKDSFADYKENTDIMDMMFDLGMNNDEDEYYVQKSSANLSK